MTEHQTRIIERLQHHLEVSEAEVERLRAELTKSQVAVHLGTEVERLRANIDIWQKTAEDALDEAGRLRAEKNAAVQEIEAWLVGERCEHPTDSPLRDENERLREAVQLSSEEIVRLRAELNLLKMGPAGSAFALEAEVERLRAESESRRQDLLLQTDATNHFKAEAYSALDEVKRLRAALKSEKEGEVCYGDFVGECFRVGRVPCSECEAWNRRP